METIVVGGAGGGGGGGGEVEGVFGGGWGGGRGGVSDGAAEGGGRVERGRRCGTRGAPRDSARTERMVYHSTLFRSEETNGREAEDGATGDGDPCAIRHIAHRFEETQSSDTWTA